MVQRRGADGDEDVTGRELGARDIGDLDDLGAAVLVEDCRSHGEGLSWLSDVGTGR